MKQVIAALLVTALNLLTINTWAASCFVSVTDVEQKPVFAQIIKASEEEDKEKKKKKKGEEEEEEEPECD